MIETMLNSIDDLNNKFVTNIEKLYSSIDAPKKEREKKGNL